jgi:hypothetical protein
MQHATRNTDVQSQHATTTQHGPADPTRNTQQHGPQQHGPEHPRIPRFLYRTKSCDEDPLTKKVKMDVTLQVQARYATCLNIVSALCLTKASMLHAGPSTCSFSFSNQQSVGPGAKMDMDHVLHVCHIDVSNQTNYGIN